MIENAEISQLNKKLIDEIDLLRNTSKSRFDEISVIINKNESIIIFNSLSNVASCGEGQRC